ncbi:N-6 DNA methylase [Nocardioides halotolerans]|uniref:N-6 DNA methylase n=1 Tax=Nocardioides halotolerans TaxID=433660 RepID=UPI000421057F|nr:N-6 DNA methylase [Nocardioides halotolerans]
MATSDIAEMADVSRGAVSNWRKRSPDFPAPVAGTPTKPLFDRAQVESWLKATGKTVATDDNLDTWSLLNTLREDLAYADIGQLALDLACLRRIHETHEAGDSAWAAIHHASVDTLMDTLRAGVEELREVLDLPYVPRPYLDIRPEKLVLVLLPFQAIDLDDLPAVTDYVLARAANAQVRAGVEHGFVDSRISRILGTLAGPDAGGTIYDPACGIGEALREVMRTHRAEHDQLMGPITRIVGHDINPAATTIARQRAYLRGEAWELTTTDVIARDPDPALQADIIVCEPPFGQRLDHAELSDPRWVYGMPPRNSTELAWVQHAVAHLAPGGRAFVVTTMGPLFRGGPESAIRRSLVENHRVEAIIGLPGKLLPHVAMPLAVWVLRPGNSDGSPAGVLMVDGSQSSNPEAEARRWYPEPPNGVPAELVAPRELATAAYDLTPTRWTGAPSLDSQAAFTSYTQNLDRLNRALDQVAGLDRPLRGFDPLDRPRIVTVGDLVEGGVVQLKTGRLRPEDAAPHLAGNIIRPRHLRDGELPNQPPGEVLGATSDLVMDNWFHEVENHTDRPRPGDVLVSTTNPITTLVYGGEWAILGAGVQSLRILTDQISPDYLAAVLLGPWNKRFLAGGTIGRAKVQDLEVPLIALAEQHLYLEGYDRLAEVAEQARLLAQWAEETRVAVLDLLRAGAPEKAAD